MTSWRVTIFEAPGRALRRIRTFRALDQPQARASAINAANQYALQARVARYRISWALWELTWPTGQWVKVDAGSLDSALDRRRSTESEG